MNTNNVKRYAPRARTAFIAAVSKQAAKYGITQSHIEPAEKKGDLALIGGRSFKDSVLQPRERLIERIEQHGFDQVMEQVAYNWFNRLCAIRYMELKGFLDHGRRVLSHPGSDTGFQILEECLDIELPGLNQARVRELKLDATKDEALYRELLLAQCRALHQAMPFLFEAVLDESELLLPENLTKTDSLIRDLVTSIPEQDWEHIEIIGWLYQFYISEKKDQVIGKVVKSEDIPAATQLFTPNWIVKYLVQNSVGRQWLQTYPHSPLKATMEYYIAPAEQTPEVQAQLAAITPTSLDPETIKVLDPACGSGHILVEAYQVLKAIYEERGYRRRDIPTLILEKNLFGLDIDDRAGQLAGFALMMLAREDDRRIFTRPPALNIQSLTSGEGIDVINQLPAMANILKLDSVEQEGLGLYLKDLLHCFQPAKTLGSLITIPEQLSQALPTLQRYMEQLQACGDKFLEQLATDLKPLIKQAVILDQKYDAVVANPPYMGSKGMNAELKAFAKKAYPNSKADLFAIFIERGFGWLKKAGFNSMVTMQSWMFLSSYEQMRESILSNRTIENMAHMGNGVMKIAFGTNATIFRNQHINGFKGSFSYTDNNDIGDDGVPFEFPVKNDRLKVTAQDDFKKIPGSPVAYWMSTKIRRLFETHVLLKEISMPRPGLSTTDNERFLRYWFEVDKSNIGFGLKNKKEALKSKLTWFPFNKGGDSRKWYGNNDFVVNWGNDGMEIKEAARGASGGRVVSENYYFFESISASAISSAENSYRFYEKGGIFDVNFRSYFKEKRIDLNWLLAFLNSHVAKKLISFLSPTVALNKVDLERLPYIPIDEGKLSLVDRLIEIAKNDWDEYERSYNFHLNPLLKKGKASKILDSSFKELINEHREITLEARNLEFRLEGEFAKVYGIKLFNTPNDAITPTLDCNPNYLFGLLNDKPNLVKQSQEVINLVSYSIGCQMGRYSLDREGLVYAHAGNEGFKEMVEEGAYKTFPADDDGIIPLTAQEWFKDDTTNRFRDFVKVVWGEEHLQENLAFVAESLCLHAIKPKKGEDALETIRRYLSTQFFKDHLKTYKKRPIYWLFSSGKQKAFECLVYLHRYTEGTLARMRTEYVTPLLSKMASYEQKLENDKDASESAAESKRLEKEITTLHKQQAELSTFDEKLRHYADQRISLDLDDGVKVNYARFGDLLAEVKAVTGKSPEVIA